MYGVIMGYIYIYIDHVNTILEFLKPPLAISRQIRHTWSVGFCEWGGPKVAWFIGRVHRLHRQSACLGLYPITPVTVEDDEKPRGENAVDRQHRKHVPNGDEIESTK